MKNWPLQKKRTRRKNVGQAAGGGSRLIEGLYRDHFKDLCRNIHKSFGGGPPEPEEVVQAAFTKFASLENPERIAEPRSFLFITARNLVLDYWRSDVRANAYIAEQIALDADLKLEEITPERVILAKDYFERLVAAVQSLPRKQQIVLAMSRLEGKSYRQIREETGWSAGDISRTMSAGMDTLMRIMEGDATARQPQERPGGWDGRPKGRKS